MTGVHGKEKVYGRFRKGLQVVAVFEPRTEYLTCREWHSEWHFACMRKPVSWHFVDVEHLLYREQVLGRENVNGH